MEALRAFIALIPVFALRCMSEARKESRLSFFCRSTVTFDKKRMEAHIFGFGVPEMLIVLAIVLVVFGVGKLPEIGSAFGKSIRTFKKASEGKEDIDISPKKENVTSGS